MITKKVLLDYIDEVQTQLYDLSDKFVELSAKIRNLEKREAKKEVKKPVKALAKAKRGPGRPKGSKNKIKK